ncbi:3-oxoacyl-ACP reductase [Terrimonas sp.]|uniref:SDR family NAD(P)-dependent oxidoreductase n=1 Tax=Terrimonas sp. TaxID=1914338 RepID=UPI000D5235AE|nr:SDR family oxidoreductase [Terrimonas sp.]PVD51257.1 3-oxoacyl-ACP reductase [Terrimonas sp.]
MHNKFDLTGKKVLITGGGKGLGFAIANTMAHHGAKVIITGRNELQLKEACGNIGTSCAYHVFDLTDIKAIPLFVEAVINKHGHIDVLVNNAGINMKKDILEVTDEDFESVIKTNQSAVFSLSREFAKRMVQRKNGVILLISSMASQYGIPKVIAYTASKSAIEGMTRAMAVELSPLGIRVNCIAPGFIETDMSSKALNSDPDRKQKVLSRTPMAKLGKPDDIGYAAAFLAGDAANYITGIVLPVDGGNAIGF